VNLADHLPILAVLVPLLTAPVAAVLHGRNLAWAAACAASTLAFALAVTMTRTVLASDVPGAALRYNLGNWPAPYGIELVVDSLGALILLLVSGASTLALLVGRNSIAQDIEPTRQPLFYAAWLTALAGLAGISVAGDAFNVFVFMEISSLASYVLIAGGTDRRALTAVFKYLVTGTLGATFYLIGVGLVYMMTGTLNFADMAARLPNAPALAPVLLAAAFVTVGLALKAAVFPLHAWLPNAYGYAPHAVTAFLAACATKVSLYVLLRFDFLVFQPTLGAHAAQFATFVLPLAAIGILFGSAVAMLETNLKRLLAYSSIAQIGYMVLGAALLDHAGLSAGILHMFNHALAKGALFLAIALLGLRAAGMELQALSGLGRRMPWTTAAFAVAAASLVGIPGTAGFISKWYLVVAAFGHGLAGIALVLVIVASSLMALAYSWKVLESLWFGTPADGDASNPAEAPPVAVVLLWVAAGANLWFGLVPALPLAMASNAAASLLQVMP